MGTCACTVQISEPGLWVPTMCSFLGESMDSEASLAFAYYKDGAADPTFLFIKYALQEEKC